jgi:hypothetical protein
VTDADRVTDGDAVADGDAVTVVVGDDVVVLVNDADRDGDGVAVGVVLGQVFAHPELSSPIGPSSDDPMFAIKTMQPTAASHTMPRARGMLLYGYTLNSRCR